MKSLTYLFAFTLLLACSSTSDQTEEKIDVGTGEQFRPVYHFTPDSAWMNDPNGMVYYEGEYHLFYQYYPDGNTWGPMHWGHAVSTDMMVWEQLPIALYPDSLGYIFSGSTVIDWSNTTGFGQDGIPPMVAIFTHHQPDSAAAGSETFQYQSLAYSLDKGRSWAKYVGNPVLDNPGIRDFRDPKVFWYGEGQSWVMILAVMDRVHLYSSPDLKSWTFLSEFGEGKGAHGGVWECPDLFRLADEDGIERWVMLVSINPGGPQDGSATQYFIGQFDGVEFIPEDDYTRWIDVGADNYAGVTWSDIPAADGRRIFLGWMSNWQYAQVVPTYTWRSAMTIPVELTMTFVKGSPEVKSTPVAEIDAYFELDTTAGNQLGAKGTRLTITDIKGAFVSASFFNAKGESVSLIISENRISLDRSKSGVIDFDPGFRKIQAFKHYLEVVDKVDIFLDRSSIEIFVNDGELAMTELIFPTEPLTQFSLSEGLKASVSRYVGKP